VVAWWRGSPARSHCLHFTACVTTKARVLASQAEAIVDR